jgi:hypothetical protein
MSFLTRLFGKTQTSTEILCPHCERSMDEGHDAETCARKGMSRRIFFGVLGGAAAAVAIAPALVKPGTGGLFNPIADLAGQYKGNQLLTPHFINLECLRILKGNVARARPLQVEYNRQMSMIAESIVLRPMPRFRTARRQQQYAARLPGQRRLAGRQTAWGSDSPGAG